MGTNTAKGFTGDIDLTGATELKLVMDKGANNWSDHGDWANAKLTKPFTALQPVVVTVQVNDPAMGSAATDKGEYQKYDTATVTATAKEGYHFVNWTNAEGTEVSDANPHVFDVTEDVTLTANFAANPVVKKQYTVTATAKEGHHFVGWKLKDAEDILSTDAKYTFKVEKDVDLIGVFEKDAEPEQVITAEEIMRRIIADKSFATSIKKDTKKLTLPEVPENAQIEICSVNPEGIIALNGEVTTPQEDTEVIVTVKVTGTDGSVATTEFKVMVEGNGETEKPAPEKPDNGNNNSNNNGNAGNNDNSGNNSANGNVNQSGAKDNNANSSTPNGGAGQNTVKAIKTGDTANFALYGIVMVAAGAVIATLVYRRKRS